MYVAFLVCENSIYYDCYLPSHVYEIECMAWFGYLLDPERSNVYGIPLDHANPELDPESHASLVISKNVFFFKQKTAYEVVMWLEFRRVLFRSHSIMFDMWQQMSDAKDKFGLK